MKRSIRYFVSAVACLSLSTMAAFAFGMTASAATVLTAAGVQACVNRVQGVDLSLAQARACAPGVPVFMSTHPPTGPVGPIFIVARSANHAVVNFSTSGTSAVRSGASSPLIATSCYNTWRYPTSSFTYPHVWGKLWAAGYGNHCGYSNVPNNPSFQFGCFCTSESQSLGHYDSTYGNNNFGQNYAAGWLNATFIGIVGMPAIDTFFCRDYVDPNANYWGWCQ